MATTLQIKSRHSFRGSIVHLRDSLFFSLTALGCLTCSLASAQTTTAYDSRLPRTLSDQLAYCTAQIKIHRPDGKTVFGTGFFFQLKLDSALTIDLLISNKHVTKHPGEGRIFFSRKSEANLPIDSEHTEIILPDFSAMWILHPDTNIDLAVMPIGPMLASAYDHGLRFFYKTIQDEYLVSKLFCDSISTVEDVLMVGYPVAVWDSSNNKPVFRRGITATHPKRHYNSKNEFLLDIACFGGSSGSPVFLYNPMGYTDINGNFVLSARFRLLGILYAGILRGATGGPEQVELPVLDLLTTSQDPTINLGVAIRADQLLAFRNPLLDLIRKTRH